MNKLRTLLAVLGLLLAAAAGAQGQPSGNATATASNYLLLLESWSSGTNADAPRQFAVFEEKVFRSLAGNQKAMQKIRSQPATSARGHTISPAGRCIVELDHYLLESVSELGPEGLLPLTFFYVQVFITHTTADQPWLAKGAKIRYKLVLERYPLRSEPHAEARRRNSQMLVAIAARLSSQSYLALIEMARDDALHAVSLTPQSYAALYWAAFLEEKLGRHKQALDLLVKLFKHHGDDPEIRLRRGVNLARLGKARAARADFESVARGAHDDAWRVLAYQELAQLDRKAGDPRAVAILDEALGVFPDDQGLRLLASFHGRPVDPVLAGDVPPSPRLRYERVREAELVAADQELIGEVESRLGGLNNTVAEIRGRIERDETAEKAFKACRDIDLR